MQELGWEKGDEENGPTARATWWVGWQDAEGSETQGRWIWRGGWCESSRELLELRKDLRVLAKANINLDSLKADRLHDNPEELEAFTYGLTRRRPVAGGAPPPAGGPPPPPGARAARDAVRGGLSERDSAFAGTVKLRTLLLHCDPRSVSQDGWPPGTVRDRRSTA